MLRSFLLIIVLVLVQLFFSESKTEEDNRVSPLEAGFEKSFGTQSMRASFLFLAVLFVFFDLELILFLFRILILE